MNNLWQILMYIQQMKEEEERKKRAMQVGQRPGPQQGVNDNGMSLEQMFQAFRPTLMNGWQGGNKQQTQPPMQQGPPGLI